MQSKRRWLGLRVWVTDVEGKRRNEILSWEDETSVLIREDGVVGIGVLSKAAEGVHWELAEAGDKMFQRSARAI